MIHYDTHKGLSDLPQIVKNAVADLEPRAAEFDSIAVQGISGAIIGAPVALALDKPLVVVRKDSDMIRPCYHISTVENARNAGRRILFLDDYVGEGKTLRDVTRKLADHTAGWLAARYECLYRQYSTGRDVAETRWAA
jgi:adenine/guanine phosphoribosyltransferase-like PRPP-binding protein